jgi:hypothetical protein
VRPDDTLYENVMVPGWIAVNGHRFEDDGETVRPTIRRRDYEVEIDRRRARELRVQRVLSRRDLSRAARARGAPKTGWDGRILTRPIPGQEALPVES